MARKLERLGIEILTGTSLVEVEADHVRLSTGATLPTRTVVWTAGVRAHPVVERLGLTLDAAGRVAVDEYLQALGSETIWALGDAASVPDPDHDWQRPCPPTAQHALRQARTAATNVAASLGFGAREPFTYRSRGVVVDLGPGATVAQMFGLPIRGFPAWLMARAYHAVQVPGARRKVAVLADWALRKIAGPAAADLREVGHPRTLFGEFEGQSAGGTSAGAPPRVPATP